MMAKTTTTKTTSDTDKPARSKTRAATTKPRAVRNVAKSVAKAPSKKLVDQISGSDGDEPIELSKKELIERMMRDADMKKGEARRALDAVLGVLGGALAEGANLSVAPLGKIKIARTKETPTGQLVVCRVKLKKPESFNEAAE